MAFYRNQFYRVDNIEDSTINKLEMSDSSRHFSTASNNSQNKISTILKRIKSGRHKKKEEI